MSIGLGREQIRILLDDLSTKQATRGARTDLFLIGSAPTAEEVRRALAGYIAVRRADKAFQARLRASLEKTREILERLAES